LKVIYLKKVEGIFAPIATIFDEAGDLDLEGFCDNVRKFNETKLSGLVVLGSNGEFALLSYREKMALVKSAKETLDRDKLLIAGTGCESLRETIMLSNESADIGVDAILVVTPSYYKSDMTDEALERYFTTIADGCKVPVMLYNMPRNTGINMGPSLVARLAKHPNIIGIKDSSGNISQIAEIIAKCPNDFAVFAGSGSFLLPTLMLGGVGGTLAVANVLPDYCAAIHDLYKEGDLDKARKLQLGLLNLNAAVTTRYGIGGMKAAMEIVGFHGGSPRLPILPASGAVKEEISKIIVDALKVFSEVCGS
jgi:4-hydroxy-2-oxoglutarate aldolase